MEYEINFYRIKKITQTSNLITNDIGRFIYINTQELDYLKKKQISKLSKITKFKLEKNNFIIEKNNSEKNNQYNNILKKKCSFLNSGPSLHIIITTLRCDQKCIYCHASSKNCSEKKYDMTFEIADKVIEKILESNTNNLNIEFQGGEPTLNFDIIKYFVKQINKQKKQKNVLFSIVSNFTIMTEDIMDFILENKFGICTSLDGPKELHNYNRKEYEKTIFWIEKINNEIKKNDLDLKISASLTITKESLKFPKEIIDEYIKNNFLYIHLRPLKKLGFAKNKDEIYYSIEEFIEFWKKTMDYILEINKNKKLIERETYYMLKKIFDSYEPNYLELRSPCGAISGQLLYNYDGNIYSCDEGRMLNDDTFLVGNVNKKINKIITCDKSLAIISSSINDSEFCNMCAYKPYCGLCPVINYAEFGTILGRISESDWCKLHKAQFDYIFDKLKIPTYKNILLSWISEDFL